MDANRIMSEFLARGDRYLWTDAYAVMNLLVLGQELKARELVDRVHETLGRYSERDKRKGWLSGLPEAQARQHPTRGGLRIGKPLPERRRDEAFDSRLEWERDGQYFHYLTRWAQALLRASKVEWARELLRAAGDAFLYSTPSGPRMYWKMSVDLSRPLVPSMGHHDPLDGLVTGLCVGGVDVSAYRSICDSQDLVSTDPLGIGGLLSAATRLHNRKLEPALYERALRSAIIGLNHYRWELGPEIDAEGRLGFRELGLAIGVLCCDDGRIDEFRGRASDLVKFWSRESSRKVRAWKEHLDINEVMLCSALLSQPGGEF